MPFEKKMRSRLSIFFHFTHWQILEHRPQEIDTWMDTYSPCDFHVVIKYYFNVIILMFCLLFPFMPLNNLKNSNFVLPIYFWPKYYSKYWKKMTHPIFSAIHWLFVYFRSDFPTILSNLLSQNFDFNTSLNSPHSKGNPWFFSGFTSLYNFLNFILSKITILPIIIR